MNGHQVRSSLDLDQLGIFVHAVAAASLRKLRENKIILKMCSLYNNNTPLNCDLSMALKVEHALNTEKSPFHKAIYYPRRHAPLTKVPLKTALVKITKAN